MSDPSPRQSSRLAKKRAASAAVSDTDGAQSPSRARTKAARGTDTTGDTSVSLPRRPGTKVDRTKLLITLMNRRSAQAIALDAACDDIMQSITCMNVRAAKATGPCAADCNMLLPVLERAHARVLRELAASVTAHDKWLDEKAEEVDAVSKQLTAVAAMCARSASHVVLLIESVSHAQLLPVCVENFGIMCCVPVCSMRQAAVKAVSAVWRTMFNKVASTLSGRGMKYFVKGAAGASLNVVLVCPRLTNRVFAEYVKPEDVCLSLSDADGSLIDARVTVEYVADGGFQLAFEVDETCANILIITVTVCGIALRSPDSIYSGFRADKPPSVAASYDLPASNMLGCAYGAVNASGSLMALSYTHSNVVHMYRLSPTLEHAPILLDRVGIRGTLARCDEFRKPGRVCFLDDTTILVCDQYNHRVQRLSVNAKGDHAVTTFVSSFVSTGMWPACIATHLNRLAVGISGGIVEIYSCYTRKLLRQFSLHSLENHDGPLDASRPHAASIRFTPNGARLLVGMLSQPRGCISVFTAHGVFVKNIGDGVLSDYCVDVSFGCGGEIIAADRGNSRFCVFSATGDTLVKAWSPEDIGITLLKYLYAETICTVGPYLYVFDNACVHVYE